MQLSFTEDWFTYFNNIEEFLPKKGLLGSFLVESYIASSVYRVWRSFRCRGDTVDPFLSWRSLLRQYDETKQLLHPERKSSALSSISYALQVFSDMFSRNRKLSLLRHSHHACICLWMLLCSFCSVYHTWDPENLWRGGESNVGWGTNRILTLLYRAREANENSGEENFPELYFLSSSYLIFFFLSRRKVCFKGSMRNEAKVGNRPSIPARLPHTPSFSTPIPLCRYSVLEEPRIKRVCVRNQAWAFGYAFWYMFSNNSEAAISLLAFFSVGSCSWEIFVFAHKEERKIYTKAEI